jgi:uncharacterized membrane protein YeaQ/YmgE (transglycosylase-associated protein family)
MMQAASRYKKMQGLLTNPITILVLKIAIGAAVGSATKRLTRSSSNSPYLLLGVAGALVGGKIADVLEVYVFGAGPFIGAVLGAAFFVIGWRQSLSR